MSFCFSFPDPNSHDHARDGDPDSPGKPTANPPDHQVTSQGDSGDVERCREVLPGVSGGQMFSDVAIIQYQISDTLSIRCLDCQKVADRLTSQCPAQCSSLVKATQAESDLIPNVYEGGLKVWECAVDLACYLHTSRVDFMGARVLELGCGAGIPGILASQRGAHQVHFQDYNEEVLEHYTIPNIALNTDTNTHTCKHRFFSGDWDSFRETVCNQGNSDRPIMCNRGNSDGHIEYDFILTAETIYQPENYQKLYRIFQQCLSKTGHVYIAAKSHYFGVGGGSQDFEAFIKKDGAFTVAFCHTIEAGLPRDIIRLERRGCDTK